MTKNIKWVVFFLFVCWGLPIFAENATDPSILILNSTDTYSTPPSFSQPKTQSRAMAFSSQQSTSVLPGYKLLDGISPGSIGSTWLLYQDGNSYVQSPSEISSPYDGSIALYQYCPPHGQYWLGRNFSFSKKYAPGTKVAVYLKLSRGSGTYNSVGVTIGAYNGSFTGVGGNGQWRTLGIGGGWTIPRASGYGALAGNPTSYQGVVEIPLNFVSQPFDHLFVGLYNYQYLQGGNSTILDQVMIQDTMIDVISIETFPTTLLIDKAGAGSGIVFKAKTSDEATVTFKVRPANGGAEKTIGSEKTTLSGSDNVAKLSWWGKLGGGGLAPEGAYEIIAEVDSSSKSTPFSVKQIEGYVINMGTWMKDRKDPSANVPKDPDVKVCPTTTWDQAMGQKPGYFAGLAVGDPVNLVSGNFSQTEVDLTLKSRLPLTFARIYNSLDPNIGPLGRGWSSPYFSHLEFLASDVQFINSDGSRTFFKGQGNSFIGPDDSDLSLNNATDTGFWTLSHPSGSVWTFDVKGKLIRIVKSCCGQGALDAVTLEYDSAGNLSRVSNPNSQRFDFSCDTAGKIIRLTDSTGRTVSFEYSSNGDLISVTDPLGRVTEYAYSPEDFLLQIKKPGNEVTAISYDSGRATRVTNPDGSFATFYWDLPNNKVIFTDLKGTEHQYQFSSKWQIQSYLVPTVGITKNFITSGSAVLGYQNSFGNSEAFTFDANGLLSSISDLNGNKTSFEYHPKFHQLTKKTDALGRIWQYTWCLKGNLISEKDPLGGVSSYTYDSHNNRISRTDQLGRTTRYVYDSNGNYLLQTIDPLGNVSNFSYDVRGNLISSADPLGRVTQFQYDALDRLTKTVSPDGRFIEIEYDNAGNVKTRKDNLGRITHYAYDLQNRLTTLTRPDGTTFSYAYNNAGQKITETDSLNRVTRFEYSPIGLLTKTIYPDGAFETMDYDTEGRLINKTNELGYRTSFEFDRLGRLLATIDPTGARWESQYDNVGRKIADKDPLNRVTSYQLDNLDRIVKTVRPDNSFTTNSFDSVGNLLSTVDALGNQWSWVYDNLNRQVKAVQPNGASSTTTFDAAGQVIAETDALGRTTQNVFDNGGRKISTIDALGNVWQNSYDSAGRLSAVKDPLGAVSSMIYDNLDRVINQIDPLGNVTGFEFDAAGRRVAKTDPMGRRTITAYDQRDRVTSEADPEGHTVIYAYNLAGQRLSLTDGANRLWKWEYDTLGRVTSEIDPLGNATRSRYDAAGNKIALTNARNQVTNFTFDPMNRVTQINYPDGAIATMAYDLEGRELVRSSSTGTVTKTYDSVGNMTSEITGPWGKKWQYSFDLVGNRIGATDPEGQVFKYSFDRLNRIVVLDPPEKRDEVKFTFDASGRLTVEERPGVKTTNTFDLAGRLLSLRHERTSGKTKLVASRNYTYSPVGNRLTAQDENNETTKYFYNNSDWLTKVQYPDGQQVSYTYNGAGDRLTETINTPTVKKVGRNTVLGTDTLQIPFGYDSAGRMISRASETYQYDNDGNLTSSVEGGITTNNTWSSDNRLTLVARDLPCEKHGFFHCKKCQTITQSEAYSYLPGSWKRTGRTATVKVDGKLKDSDTFVSVFDGDDESHEYQIKTGRDRDDDKDDRDRKDKKCLDKDDKKLRLKIIREFIGGPGTDDLVATKYHGRTLEMLKDGLGSTIALTNRGGVAVSRVNYDAWGNLRFSDKPGHGLQPCRENDLDNLLDRLEGKYSFGDADHDGWHYGRHFGKVLTPYLYAGRRFDNFSNLYNNRNRMLNPRFGRFISRDPIGFAGGRNLWGYAKNNPVRFTDPFGLLGISISPYAWKYEINRWVKPYHFTLEEYQPTPQASSFCPDYVVVQWTRGFVKYAKAPSGWKSEYQEVSMYGHQEKWLFMGFQVDSSEGVGPIFNAQGDLVKFPRSSNSWWDNLKFQKTLDPEAYPLTAKLEFATVVYPFATIKDSLKINTLNSNPAYFIYSQPPAAANRFWQLSFTISSLHGMPIEDSSTWP